VGEGGVPAEASWRGLSGSAAVGHDGDRAHTKQGAAMSLLNSAKNFALKNKDKVAAGVDKATTVIDKKTGGKHTDKLRKLDEAAAKFAGKPVQKTTVEDAPATPVIDEPPMPKPG
jgi:hypothetical protein